MLRPVLHDIVVLRCAGPARAAGPVVEGRCTEWTADQGAEVQQVFQALGRRMPPERIARRFRHGLRFFAFGVGDEIVASTWLVTGGHRYIDELNWSFPVAADGCWVRDVFVAPGWRGRGVYARFLLALTTQAVPACRTVWSDVDASNLASLKAHAHAGFEPVVRLRALELFGRLRLRGAAPAWTPAIADLAPQRRWVLLTGELKARHEALIA